MRVKSQLMGEYINFLWPTICSFMIYFQFSEQNYLFHGSKCFLDSRHSPRSLKCLCKNIRGFAGFSIRTVSTMVAKQFNPENFQPWYCPQNYSWNSLRFVSKIIIQNCLRNLSRNLFQNFFLKLSPKSSTKNFLKVVLLVFPSELLC